MAQLGSGKFEFTTSAPFEAMFYVAKLAHSVVLQMQSDQEPSDAFRRDEESIPGDDEFSQFKARRMREEVTQEGQSVSLAQRLTDITD